MLVDDELRQGEIQELLRHLKRDDHLKSCWENYHLIGDALRKNLPPYILPDLSDRIAAAIQNEPTYFLPQHAHDGFARTSSDPASGSKTDFEKDAAPAQGRVPRNSSRNSSRAFGGFALAASITALAVVGVMQGVEQGDAPAVQAPAMIASVSGAPSAALSGKPEEAAQFTARAQVPPQAPEAVAEQDSLDLRQHEGATVAVVAQESGKATAASDPAPVIVATVAAEAETGVNYPAEAADLYDYLVNYQRYARTVSLQNGFSPAIQLVGYSP